MVHRRFLDWHVRSGLRLCNAGLTGLLGQSASGGLFAASVVTGFIAAFLSSIMSNMPTVMTEALAIHGLHSAGLVRQGMILANVIGCDPGPKITPIGSLATLLWLHQLSKTGIVITWKCYLKTGIVLTIPTLFITLSGLYLWLRFIG